MLLAGENPYHDPRLSVANEYPWNTPLYYPLPALLVALPTALLPAAAAGAVFTAAGAGLLAYGLTRDGYWRLPLLLSAPSVMAITTGQWAPLLLALTFVPGLQALGVVLKPNLGLPLGLVYARWQGWLLAGAVGMGSLLLLPSWPLDWLANIRQPSHHLPPLLILPFGPLLLRGLLAWRHRVTWVLLLMSLIPQRLIWYDQLPLGLVPQTMRAQFVWVVCTWVGWFLWAKVFDYSESSHGLLNVLFAYLPALTLLLYHYRHGFWRWPRTSS